MVHVNETIVIKSSSPKMAEWVKKLKAHKAEQLEKLLHLWLFQGSMHQMS